MADAPGSPKAPEPGAIEAPSIVKSRGQRRGPGKPFPKGNKLGKPFSAGQSGNPGGLTKAEQLYREAMRDNLPAEAVAEAARALRAMAKGGDVSAIRLVLDRTVGPLADAPKVALTVVNVERVREVVPAATEAEWQGELRAIEGRKP